MPMHSSPKLSRAALLRSLGAFAAGSICAPLITRPLAARAVIPVFDPAAVAALLRQLSNDFVKNKETLYIINVLLHQWNSMQMEHQIDIGALWPDIEPKLIQFQDQLVKNKQLGVATDNILKALQEALPDYNPSDPIHTGIEIYQNYIDLSEQTAKAAVANAAATTKTRQQYRDKMTKDAMKTNTQRGWFQYSFLMSKDVADGIDLLQGSIGGLVNATANYFEGKGKEEKLNNDLGDQSILRLAGGNLVPPPSHPVADYVNGKVQLVPYSSLP